MREVPVIVLGHLGEAQRRALTIADNRLALDAGWDDDLLAAEIEALRGEAFDLSLVGFSDEELRDILEPHGPEHAAERIPEPPVVPVSKPGDLFTLGRHRLLCGDATEPGDWARVLGGRQARICLTDPPYGLGTSYDGFIDTAENVRDLARKWLPLARQHAEVVVFSPSITGQWFYPPPSWVLCWFYGGGALRSPWGFNCWQPFLAYGADPSLANGAGCRPDAFSINVPANSADIKHPCPKPLDLWRALIERLSFHRTDLVVDCFGGAGTTLLVCEEHGRSSCTIERSAVYCDVTIKRWQDLTGKGALLEGDGRSFAEIAPERMG